MKHHICDDPSRSRYGHDSTCCRRPGCGKHHKNGSEAQMRCEQKESDRSKVAALLDTYRPLQQRQWKDVHSEACCHNDPTSPCTCCAKDPSGTGAGRGA